MKINLFEEQLFWYHPWDHTLNHERFDDSSFMYTRIQQLCQEHNCTINCWDLSNNGWYTSAMNGGSSPFRTNLHQVIADNVPADIKLLCTLLNIQWRP